MLRRILTAAAGVAFALVAFTAPPASASPASASSLAPRSITVSGGGEYSSYVPQAIQIWNSHVPNIRMSQVTSGGNIRIYVVSGGGSRASIGHGSGTIYLDRLQINQGYSPLRVVAHEMGHSLGLRDNYNGSCTILMSGGSAGTACRNPNPSAAEADWVNRSFAGGFRAADSGKPTEWSVDSWPAPAAVPVAS
ncbi:snapalysin [Saccharothrix tamanrassetensis]|uniref:Extracellular small neutral protease n=1 Tax=Saccharothrix tamanrassetensis TaxID=1051531 RepID=A0A841C5K2_9PSEU|nr:snapalysin family zinc-dependent metalloprotease [Saccharothrix tamanrassetensis]MBB5953812.1 snapalysin [Saccharothrix tamanrassetensis]